MNKKQQFNQDQFFDAIELVSKNNLINNDEIFKIIRDTITKTFHTKYDPDANLEVIIEPDKNIFKLINHSILIVDDQTYDDKYSAIEISLSEAKKKNPHSQVGEMISCEVSFDQFSSQIKQLLTQTLRERKKENVFAKHKSLVGEMIDGEVTAITKNGDVILILPDQTTAFMPHAMRNMKVDIVIGEHIKVYVEEVKKESRDSQIIVSNGSKEIIKRIIEVEVPEIKHGVIEIIAIARIPGERSKVAVKSNDQNVDPIGAIIGSEGKRIAQILNKLNGEKIDIILWSEDTNSFIANALEPAKVISVMDKFDESGNLVKNTKIVITPQIHQTLAIGKNGINVRLAVELTKTNIDIISLNKAKELNMTWIWNGTINQEDLVKLESGMRLTRQLRNVERFNRHPKQKVNNLIDFNEFNDDIRSFAETIVDSNAQQMTEEIESTTIFSDEELRKMEAEFGLDFDDELSNYEPDDEDNFE